MLGLFAGLRLVPYHAVIFCVTFGADSEALNEPPRRLEGRHGIKPSSGNARCPRACTTRACTVHVRATVCLMQ
jgi:hypothetical protein